MKSLLILYYIVSSLDQPKIAPVQTKILIKIGKQASLTCILEQGNLPIEFKWKKGENDIRSSENAVIENSQRISGLIIKSVTISDSGNYSCTVSNEFGSDMATFQLVVEGLNYKFIRFFSSFLFALFIPGPPQWLSKPTDIKIGPREQIQIQCSGIGHPPPTTLWKKLIGELKMTD